MTTATDTTTWSPDNKSITIVFNKGINAGTTKIENQGIYAVKKAIFETENGGQSVDQSI